MGGFADGGCKGMGKGPVGGGMLTGVVKAWYEDAASVGCCSSSKSAERAMCVCV